jgi:hypothetical protein
MYSIIRGCSGVGVGVGVFVEVGVGIRVGLGVGEGDGVEVGVSVGGVVGEVVGSTVGSTVGSNSAVASATADGSISTAAGIASVGTLVSCGGLKDAHAVAAMAIASITALIASILFIVKARSMGKSQDAQPARLGFSTVTLS